MTREYVEFPEGVGVEPPNGGLIYSTADKASSPTGLYPSETGVSFGPLALGLPSGGRLGLDKLTFLPGETGGSNGVLFLGIASGGAATATPDAGTTRTDAGGGTDAGGEVRTTGTRRDVLALSATVLAAAAVGHASAAQDEELETLRIAKLNVRKSTGPVNVRVLDTIDKVLPHTTEIMVDVGGSREGEIGDPSPGVTIPSGTKGDMSVYLKGSQDDVTEILAWATGIASGNETVQYADKLPRPASEYGEDRIVKLTTHPAVIEPFEESGPDRTHLQIGKTEIPHADDDPSEAGSYTVSDGGLWYVAGPEPPESDRWEVKTRMSTWEAVSERYL